MNMKVEEFEAHKKYKDLQVKKLNRLDQLNDPSRKKDQTRNSAAQRFIINSSNSNLLSLTQSNEALKSTQKVPEDYEKIIIKLEADVRNHIRVEQQLKLHIESQQFQFDDTIRCQEQALVKLETDIKALSRTLDVKNKELERIHYELKAKDKPL